MERSNPETFEFGDFFFEFHKEVFELGDFFFAGGDLFVLQVLFSVIA